MNCFGEEEAARVAGRRMIVDPGEKIFVQHVKQEKRYKGKAIDYGRENRVAECDDNQQGY